MNLAIWLLVVALGAALFLLAAVAVIASRRARGLDAELSVSREALRQLGEAVSDLQGEVSRQRRELDQRDEPAYVITDLGSSDSGTAVERRSGRIVLRPTVPERLARGVELSLGRFLNRPRQGPGLVRRVVDHSAVRVVAVGFGVARALRPEARDRIEFASRTEMRRSRRRREYEMRLARRMVRSGQVVRPRDHR